MSETAILPDPNDYNSRFDQRGLLINICLCVTLECAYRLKL